MADKKNSIFIVDDNSAHRSLIKRALQKAGIANPLCEAGSLREARASLVESKVSEEGRPILALIDLNLGDGRGTELIRELRTLEHYSLMPIIVLSTSQIEQDIEQSYRLGASCYLIKANDVTIFRDEITSAVRFWLGQTEKA